MNDSCSSCRPRSLFLGFAVALALDAPISGCKERPKQSPPPGASASAAAMSIAPVTARPTKPKTTPPAVPTSEAPEAASPSAASAPSPVVCPGWKVGMTGQAIAPLSHFCEAYPPCPKTPEGAAQLELFGAPPRVESFAEGLVIGYGSAEQGKQYGFGPDGTLIGVSLWNEEPFGVCRRKAIRYTGGAIPEPAEGSAVESCMYVPGRKLRPGRICACLPPTDRPPLVGLDRGPRLTLALECLYELGVAGTLCRSTLADQRDMPEALLQDAGCGRTLVSSPMFGSDCLYARSGGLAELRVGERYVSSGFGTPCAR